MSRGQIYTQILIGVTGPYVELMRAIWSTTLYVSEIATWLRDENYE